MEFKNLKIIEVPVDKVIIPENRFSSKINVNWLCRNMKLSNFILPIVVKKDKVRGRYVLIDGGNRLLCAKRNGLTAVPAIVVDAPNVEYINLLINYVRGIKCGWDTLVSINQLVNDGIDIRYIANLINRSKDTVRIYVNTYRKLMEVLSETDVEYLRANCIPLRKLVTCANADNPKDCIYGKTQGVKRDDIKFNQAIEQIRDHLEYVIKKGVPPDIIISKLYEALDEYEKRNGGEK